MNYTSKRNVKKNLEREVDIISLETLEDEQQMFTLVRENIEEDKVKIYKK